VRLNPNGNIIEADLAKQAEEKGLELEWIRHNMDSIRLDRGFCIKGPKLSCDFIEQHVGTTVHKEQLPKFPYRPDISRLL
jgi:hypothetical protein